MGEPTARQSHLGSLGVGGGSLLSAHSAWTDSWKNAPEEPAAPEEVRISVELLDTLESDDPGIHGDYSPNILVATLPLIGRIHLLKHKVGFVTVGFIVLYWIYGTWSTICVILKPHYDDGEVSGTLIFYYMVVSVLCITSLFRAVTSNPGRIPFSHEAAVAPENMTAIHCTECKRRRPQRSHHCRRCGQCILRMDHHCPWINNCVGQENHWVFMQLLWYAFLMSISTFAFCMCHIYYWPPCRSCDKEAYTFIHQTGFLTGATICGILMSLFAGILLLQQTVSISLESWQTGDSVLSLSIGLALGMLGGAGGLLGLHLFSIVRGQFAVWRLYVALVTVGLAAAMAASSLSLLMAHILGLRTDMTTIDWMRLQHRLNERGGMVYLDDVPKATKSCLQAHQDLCGGGSRLMWPFPCRRRRGPLYVSYPQVV